MTGQAQIDGLLHLALFFGRCARASSACSQHPTASRYADRAGPWSPPAGSTSRALSHTSPRRACWARRSTCSSSRSPASVSSAVHNLGMQDPPPLLEQTAVGHLVRQGVLEGVVLVGEEPCLVEELGRLQVRQTRGAATSQALRQWSATGPEAPPCQSRQRSAGGACPLAVSGPYALPALPVPWPAPEWSGRACARR